MFFDLRIFFTGLCLFTPDPDGKAMRVLMRASETTSDHGADTPDGHAHHAGGSTAPADGTDTAVHVPALFIDRAYLSRELDKLTGQYLTISLKGFVMDLPARGSTLSLWRPSALARLDGSVPDDVRTFASNRVGGAVVLRSGGFTDWDRGEEWEWDGDTRRLSHRLLWTMHEVPGVTFKHKLKQLSGGAGPELPELHPVDGEITLEVWHVPPPQIFLWAGPPVKLKKGDPAEHFGMLCDLVTLSDGTGEPPAPRFSDTKVDPRPIRGEEGKGASGTSCVGATVPR